MAYTVEIIVTPGSGNVTATARSGGAGTASSSGYAITQVAGNLHTITIAEELLGPWALTAGDENSMRLVTFSESKSEYLLSGPTDANVTHFLGEPAQPLDDVAKEETVQEVLGAVGTMAAEAVRVPSPNVRGNLNLVSGDTYDGIANAKPSWIVAADYTDGWSVALTIRSKNDEVVLTATGEVESASLVSVGLVGPTGLEFEGCPGVWQGKYDVQLSKGESRKTIAVGACYVTEDQTR